MIEVAHWKRWATSILEGFVTVYLGSLGRMIPIYSTPSAQLETEERYTFTRTLEGRRKAQVKANGPRTWILNAQFADPTEQGALAQFANGEWGNGPFNFVSADAPVTNLLTPAASASDPTPIAGAIFLPGGPLLLPDGAWSGRSILNTDPAQILPFGLDFVPVVAGQAVTASAYVRGANAGVRIYFYDAVGAILGQYTSPMRATASTFVRCAITAVPPAGAVSCRAFGYEASQVTRPAVTWTDSMLDWADGQGCAKAVVHSFSRDQVLAVPGSTYSNLSFTVSEVG